MHIQRKHIISHFIRLLYILVHILEYIFKVLYFILKIPNCWVVYIGITRFNIFYDLLTPVIYERYDRWRYELLNIIMHILNNFIQTFYLA